MAIAMLIRRFTNCKLVFDVRGLMAEEYADAGVWKEGSVIFRLVKRIERSGIERADQVVVLTRRMKKWITEQGLTSSDNIEVIPCCVDFGRFELNRASSEQDDRMFEIIYAGAAAGLYLVDEMARFFLALRLIKPNAFFRILTTTPRDCVVDKLKAQGLRESDYWVGAVPAQEVPAYLKRAQLGLSFRTSTFSQIAASPTKIPEYLAAGIPVVCNSGVGDMDELVESAQVGVVVRSFNAESYQETARRALELTEQSGISARCLDTAARHFDLEVVGAAGYLRVYNKLKEAARPTDAPVTVPF
jgi:glycosyltransferase involved in cell wall biosynthesis